MRSIRLDISGVDKKSVDRLITERSGAEPIIPELVEEKAIRKPEAYNRFRDLDNKEKFRKKLIAILHESVAKNLGKSSADKIITAFKKLAADMDTNGAIIFGNMIHLANFQELIKIYSEKLSTDGSKSWIHSYINFGNHPDFLSNQTVNGAFAHPLLIALISHAAGGPIRMVDARGKDAEPLAVQAQDNMLHIDNTPFRKEYKIILTWERGKPSGPKGQNFVFIPGTHKGVRNCFVSQDGNAWSTEDGSIFTSEKSVQKIFDMQEKILPGQSPSVVEASHPTMPLTTLFEAGALVHHRYRTKEKNIPRSCIIVAFHRAQDNPGQLLDKDHLDKVTEKGSLIHLLMGKHSDNTEAAFMTAISSNGTIIADKIRELSQPESTNSIETKANNDSENGSRLISFSNRILDNTELNTWKATVTAAPTVEAIKINNAFFHLGDTLTHALLTEMMKYDKHGPLDLILYGDGHEEIRKWARNRIREMSPTQLENRVAKIMAWDLIEQPESSQLLTPLQLKNTARDLTQFIEQLSDEEKRAAYLEPQEKISRIDAYRSLRQLIDDIGEAITRCTSRQTFLSTSLFLFWASDELARLYAGADTLPAKPLMAIMKPLLANYISTSILIEKQIHLEKQLQGTPAYQSTARPSHPLFNDTPRNKSPDERKSERPSIKKI
jgi:hypothetical protein